MWVSSLASLSGLRIQCCHKLWHRSDATRIPHCCGCGTDLQLQRWFDPIAVGVALKRQKRKKRIQHCHSYGRGHSCSWDSIPVLGTSICCGCSHTNFFKKKENVWHVAKTTKIWHRANATEKMTPTDLHHMIQGCHKPSIC